MKLPRFSEKTTLYFIFIFNLALRLFRIWEPAYPYFDEKPYYLPAVRSILAGKGDPNFQHPPLAKELIALAVKLFGDNLFAWRCFQAILASLVVVFVYLLAKRMFGGRVVPTISAILLTFEFGWFVNSRVAIPEMFTASFFFLSFYFAYAFFQEKKRAQLLLTSLFFGLSLASKWNALIGLPLILFLLFYRREKINWKNYLKRFAVLAVISAAIYVGSYLFVINNLSPTHFLNLQYQMFNFHTELYSKLASKILQTRHEVEYLAWYWPLNNFLTYNFETSTGSDVSKTIVLFYHPFILWGGLLLVAWKIKNFLFSKKLELNQTLLSAGFLIFWLPWIFNTRPAYPYYWISGIPFVCVLLGETFGAIYRKDRFLVYGVMGTLILLFIFYYPILSNWPVKSWYLRLLTGFIG